MTERNYYEIEITNMQNGYLVQARYKEQIKDTGDKYDRYNYEVDKFVYTKWEEVEEFVRRNELEIPPQ